MFIQDRPRTTSLNMFAEYVQVLCNLVLMDTNNVLLRGHTSDILTCMNPWYMYVFKSDIITPGTCNIFKYKLNIYISYTMYAQCVYN